MEHANRARMVNVPEIRDARPFECRANEAGQIVLEGYAATYEPYDLFGGPDAGGWREQIQPTAFDVTLAAKPDLMLLVNHEGMPLARTTSGTLQLSRDVRGLRVRALLDRGDPDVQRLLPKMKPQANGRSNMDEMSFGFRVKDQLWDSSYTQRTITEINLQHGDVSIVNYGANHTTSAALGMLAELSTSDFAELRGKDPDLLERVITNLATLRADKPKKYEDVENFADPGYLDAQGNPAKDGNGVKRYPLNTPARVRNAAARFAQNKGQYSSEQQSAIMGKIKAAGKRMGIDISDDGDKKSFVQYSAPGVQIQLPDGTRVTLPTATVRGDMPDMIPLGHGDPSEVPFEVEEDEDEGPDAEAFTPARENITVGPLAAALAATISEAYRMAADNDDSNKTLLAKAADLLDQIRGIEAGETDVDYRLKALRGATRAPSAVRLDDALAKIRGVSQPAPNAMLG